MQLAFSRLEKEIYLDRWCKQQEAQSKRIVPNVACIVKGLIKRSIDYASREHNARVFAECTLFGNSISPVVRIPTREQNYYVFHNAHAWFCSAEMKRVVSEPINRATENIPEWFRRCHGVPEELLFEDFFSGAKVFSFKVVSVTGLFVVFSTLNADRPARANQRQIA